MVVLWGDARLRGLGAGVGCKFVSVVVRKWWGGRDGGVTYLCKIKKKGFCVFCVFLCFCVFCFFVFFWLGYSCFIKS